MTDSLKNLSRSKMRIRIIPLFLLVAICILSPIRCEKAAATGDPKATKDFKNNGLKPQSTGPIEGNVHEYQPNGGTDGSYPAGSGSDNPENRTPLNRAADLTRTVTGSRGREPTYRPGKRGFLRLWPNNDCKCYRSPCICYG